MILLYTDFGLQGPYVGQMHSVLAEQAPQQPVIDLMHDAPRFNARAAGQLLTALAVYFPATSVCVAVIDPGVGSERRPVAINAGGHWFVGPDNGLFDALGTIFEHPAWFEISWRPESLSSSFHGRDLFAPIAAALASDAAESMLTPIPAPPAVGALQEIIYIDDYGNAMTGLRANDIPRDSLLRVGDQSISQADTFSAVPVGTAFWYCNSLGLAEIALNQGSAADVLGLAIGEAVQIQTSS